MRSISSLSTWRWLRSLLHIGIFYCFQHQDPSFLSKRRRFGRGLAGWRQNQVCPRSSIRYWVYLSWLQQQATFFTLIKVSYLFRYLITHKHTRDQLIKFSKNIKETGQLCGENGEFQSRTSYVYDFSVPPSQCCARVNKSSIPWLTNLTFHS